MAFETGETFRADIKNPASSATGLIQFMSSTAWALKTSIQALAAMTAEDQLQYVYHYFEPFKGKIKSLEDCYMAILFPKAIGQPLSFRMFEQGDKYYFANRGLDGDKDGSVTKAEAAAKVIEKLALGLKEENRG